MGYCPPLRGPWRIRRVVMVSILPLAIRVLAAQQVPLQLGENCVLYGGDVGPALGILAV
jgi:hypothetical protein